MAKKKMTKSQYEKSPIDRILDKKMGYKEGSAKDEKKDAEMMLQAGMLGRKSYKKKNK